LSFSKPDPPVNKPAVRLNANQAASARISAWLFSWALTQVFKFDKLLFTDLSLGL
jgi:hypothetical protein